MRSNVCALVAVLLSVSIASVHAAPRATAPAIYNLGTLGGTNSYGHAINNRGQVAGYSYTADGTFHAFIYTGTPGSGGVMHDLGTLGGTGSVGHAINPRGQVTGESHTTGESDHAFLHTGTPGSGVIHDLGTLGGTYSFGYAINARGQVAGTSYTADDAAFHAFLYTGTPGSGGAMVDMGTLGGTLSDGFAINAGGQVTGTSQTMGDSAYHAFIYIGTPGSGGGMHDLGSLGGSYDYSVGLAINNRGQVTGSSSTAGDAAFHAFLYTGMPGSGGVMHDLGTLGGTFAEGHANNAHGQVAGWSYTADPNDGMHAFLYTGTPGVDGQMIDLDAWLDANNPAEGANWTLTQALGLNDRGLITGYGIYDDGAGVYDRAFLLDASALLRASRSRRAFLLDASAIPEPGSFSLLALGGLTLLPRRRRCCTVTSSWLGNLLGGYAMLGKMMRFITCFTRQVSAAVAACWLVWGSPALANEDIWKTAASGVWSVGSNWLDGSTPGNSDEATFDRAGVYTVTFNGDPLAIQLLTLSNSANVTFTSSTFVQPSKLRVASSIYGLLLGTGATLTLGTSGGIFQPDKPLHLIVDGGVFPVWVGTGATFNVNFGSQVFCNADLGIQGGGKFLAYGTLAITNGSLVSDADAVISALPRTGSGAVTVSGAGSRWINSGTLEIGGRRGTPGIGNGSLLISGGGVVENSDARLGGLGNSSPSSVGDVTVTGSGSIWKTSNRLELGIVADYGGPGIINIQPGGTVAVGNEMVIGSDGLVHLQGGTLDAGKIQFSDSGQLEWTSGKLSVGTFHGHLGNYGDGVLAPGHSAGSTAITGNYEQSLSGTLEIEVGGAAQASQHDVVNVTGLAVLGGQLDLKLINGFTPSPTQTFIIMTAGSFSGAFANAPSGQRLTTSNGGGSFLVNYGLGSTFDPTLLVLSNFQVGGLPGDYNQNGVIDAADFVVWRKTLGQTGSGLAADGNGNNQIDTGDYNFWRARFGQTSGSGAALRDNAVPEPGGLAFLTLAAIAFLRRRRRTHRF